MSKQNNGDNFTWKQLGQDLKQEGPEDSLTCTTMALSGDGSTLVVGPRFYEDYCPGTPDFPAGHVRAYQWHAKENQWIRKGSDLDTLVAMPNDHDYDFGFDISLSKDGNRMVVLQRQDGTQPIDMAIFQWNKDGNDWELVGGYVSGRSSGYMGVAALSDNGETLLFGTHGRDMPGVVRAHKCLFDQESGSDKNSIIE